MVCFTLKFSSANGKDVRNRTQRCQDTHTREFLSVNRLSAGAVVTREVTSLEHKLKAIVSRIGVVTRAQKCSPAE